MSTLLQLKTFSALQKIGCDREAAELIRAVAPYPIKAEWISAHDDSVYQLEQQKHEPSKSKQSSDGDQERMQMKRDVISAKEFPARRVWAMIARELVNIGEYHAAKSYLVEVGRHNRAFNDDENTLLERFVWSTIHLREARFDDGLQESLACASEALGLGTNVTRWADLTIVAAKCLAEGGRAFEAVEVLGNCAESLEENSVSSLKREQKQNRGIWRQIAIAIALAFTFARNGITIQNVIHSKRKSPDTFDLASLSAYCKVLFTSSEIRSDPIASLETVMRIAQDGPWYSSAATRLCRHLVKTRFKRMKKILTGSTTCLIR